MLFVTCFIFRLMRYLLTLYFPLTKLYFATYKVFQVWASASLCGHLETYSQHGYPIAYLYLCELFNKN